MAAGWQVAIASDGGDGSHPRGVQWFEQNGLSHYTIRFPSPESTSTIPIRTLRSVLDMRSAVRSYRPDLIHVHYRVTSPFAQLARIVYGIPFVTTLHLSRIPSGLLYRLSSFWGDRTIAISGEVKKSLESSFHVNKSRIRLVPNGVDEDYFRPPSLAESKTARSRLGVESDVPVAALIGRMSEAKGHDVLVRALARLRQQGCRVVALCAGVSIEGDTQWRDSIMAMTRELGVADQVRLLGFTEAREVLWASDVSVLPSRVEGFPLVVIESMLSGVVMVRTPAGGATEQIDDGENGFIVPFDDSDSLAGRIKLLIEDTGLRRRMAVAAREKALSSFSSRAMVSKTLAVYNEVLESRPRHPAGSLDSFSPSGKSAARP